MWRGVGAESEQRRTFTDLPLFCYPMLSGVLRAKYEVREHAWFWTSSPDPDPSQPYRAIRRGLFSLDWRSPSIYRGLNDKEFGGSIRCVFELESRRFSGGAPREDRVCFICSIFPDGIVEVGDVEHFICRCPLLNGNRELLWDVLRRFLHHGRCRRFSPSVVVSRNC